MMSYENNNTQTSVYAYEKQHFIPDAQWVQIQQNTFIYWLNEQLKNKNIVLTDLKEDIRDGVILILLLEELANKSIINYVQSPQTQHEKLQNVGMALDVLSRDGVKVTNIDDESRTETPLTIVSESKQEWVIAVFIDSTDIVRGNVKVILTLIWQLILRYQVGLSAVQHRQWFLRWLKAVLPDQNISNFGRDWNDGIVLYALIEFCRPGLCPHLENISRHDRLNNCRNAMKLARHHLGVPIVLRPEDLASPDLDERSAITYLSYFIKYGGPGYLATLERIQNRIRSRTIRNFTTDWQDGEVLEELVTSSGRDLPIIDEDTPVEKIKKCINVGRFLGVEPILTAEEITEENKEHLGIMTYAAQFLPHNSKNMMNSSSVQYRSSSPPPVQFRSLSPNPGHFRTISPNPGQIRSSSPPPVRFRSLSPNPGQYRSRPRSPPDYKPVLSNSGGYKTIVPIYSEAPSSTSQYSQNSMYRSSQTYSQQQTISNFHDISLSKISMFDDDSNYSTRTSSLMTNSIQPHSHHSNHVNSNQGYQGNFNVVRHTETNSLEFNPEAYKIDCYSVGVIFETKISRPFDPEKVRVEAVAPNGRVVKVTGDGHYSAQFMHTEIGEWRVSLFYKDRYLDGCAMDICDPSQVRVLGLKGGIVGQRQEFKIDSSKGGEGEVAADIKHNGRQVIANVSKIEPGLYRVSYTPYDPGPYSIDVTFNGAEVRESDTNPSDPEERQRKAVFYTELTEADNDKIKIKTSCDWEIDYMTGGPFICHVTDGSDIQVYGMNDGTICAAPQLLVDCSKGGGGHLHVEVKCKDRIYTAKMTEEKNNVYRVTFKPSGPGVYQIHLTYNGSPVKGSPFIQEIDELELPMAQGEGLLRGLPNQPTTFIVDPRGVQGPVSVNVIGPRHPVKSYIETQSNGTYKVYYTAIEKGQHHIDVRVDNKPLEGSPFKPWVVDPVMVRVSGGWKSFTNEGGFIPLVVNKEKHIPFDASEAGPGELTAEVRGPTGKIPVAIDARNDGRNTVIFTPRAEGHHDIDVFWGGFQLRNSPYPGWATHRSDVEIDRMNIGPPPVRYAYTRTPPPSDMGSIRSDYPLVSVHGSEMDIYSTSTKHSNMVKVLPNGAPPNKVVTRGPLKVILRGKGLKEAFIDKEAQFYIDGTQCNDGVPEAKMSSQKASIPIKMEKHGPRVYRCTYVPKVPGAYLLYIKWDNQPLRGSPFKINVKGQHKAHRVRFVVDDIKKTRVGKDVDIHIDTRDAGPGELITKVISPDGDLMEHRVVNNPDGTRRLTFLPKMIGRHIVDILYDDVHIHGSPYYIDIQAVLPTGEVRVWGPGIESGILGDFQSHFWCEADGAGAGELRVKIMGPKGAFHVKMRKAKKQGKLFQCFYNPIEAGIYTVYVMWSGQHIEGSPFTVLLAENQEELERFQASPPEVQRYPSVDDNGDVLY